MTKCPLCEKKLYESKDCGHAQLAARGYFSTDGKFYLTRTKKLVELAEKMNFDIRPFIEKNISNN